MFTSLAHSLRQGKYVNDGMKAAGGNKEKTVALLSFIRLTLGIASDAVS